MWLGLETKTRHGYGKEKIMLRFQTFVLGGTTAVGKAGPSEKHSGLVVVKCRQGFATQD